MPTNDHIHEMLELIEHPAFSVQAGVVTGVNSAAAERMIQPGQPIHSMLPAGKEEFDALQTGTMSLTLELYGFPLEATVTCVGEHRIFRILPDEASELMRVLALAAQELRSPLHDAMALTQALRDADPGADPGELNARLNRELHRILRIVGNMSFRTGFRPEMQDVGAVLSELFESAAHYCAAAGVTVEYTGPNAPVYSMVDSDLLGRAVHNLLSNAIRGAGKGGTITAHLKRRGATLYLTVEDSGGGEAPPAGRIFDAWRREPGISSHSGLGLGMTIVEAAAKAHGGVVMLQKVPGSGTRVTVTLTICQDGGLRSPRIRVDYAGDQCRELIEFADSLPPEFYK